MKLISQLSVHLPVAFFGWCLGYGSPVPLVLMAVLDAGNWI
jgi:hypothetical protein